MTQPTVSYSTEGRGILTYPGYDLKWWNVIQCLVTLDIVPECWHCPISSLLENNSPNAQTPDFTASMIGAWRPGASRHVHGSAVSREATV